MLIMNITEIDNRFRVVHKTSLTIPSENKHDKFIQDFLATHQTAFGSFDREATDQYLADSVSVELLVSGRTYMVELITDLETTTQEGCFLCLREYGAFFVGIQGLLLFWQQKPQLLTQLLILATEYQDPNYLVSL